MKTVLLSLLVLAFARCSEQPLSGNEAKSESVIIRSGSSFGMCRGYCDKDLEIVGTRMSFTKSSRNDATRYPTRLCTRTLADLRAANLRALALFSEFKQIPATLGCPDCADGGAEYLELQAGEQKHRVKFEYGKTIPGFETLVRELRAEREAFNDCE